MLRGWYQPEQGSIWLNGMVFNKLNGLKLVPEQQVVLDQGLRSDQWCFSKDQAQQPFNDMKRHLVASMVTYRQASTILFTNADQVSE